MEHGVVNISGQIQRETRDTRYRRSAYVFCVLYGIHRDKIRNKIFSLLPSCLKIRCTCAFDQLHQARYAKECFSNWIFFLKMKFQKRRIHSIFSKYCLSISAQLLHPYLIKSFFSSFKKIINSRWKYFNVIQYWTVKR